MCRWLSYKVVSESSRIHASVMQIMPIASPPFSKSASRSFRSSIFELSESMFRLRMVSFCLCLLKAVSIKVSSISVCNHFRVIYFYLFFIRCSLRSIIWGKNGICLLESRVLTPIFVACQHHVIIFPHMTQRWQLVLIFLSSKCITHKNSKIQHINTQ
jgi:hypothetical protein